MIVVEDLIRSWQEDLAPRVMFEGIEEGQGRLDEDAFALTGGHGGADGRRAGHGNGGWDGGREVGWSRGGGTAGGWSLGP